ncbi:DVU0772 family protein [Nitrospirota bacterium]
MELLSLESMKSNEFFMENIRFDVTPEDIFKTRHVRTEEEKEQANKETQGYSFYIESMQEPYAIIVMRTANLTSKAVGELIEAPQDLLKAAVEVKGVKEYCGMYPISQEIAEWLRAQLGL